MRRREFMSHGAGLGLVVAATSLPGSLSAAVGVANTANEFVNEYSDCAGGAERLIGAGIAEGVAVGGKLTPPATGKIPVAFAISEGVTVIDFAGPWEVFQDVHVAGRGQSMEDQMPFQLFTVSEKAELVTGSGGLKLVPDYSFSNAPTPKVVVVPAQRGSAALHEWLRKVTEQTDVTMSVCTGAFQLGKAGLLKGKTATTHHDFLDRFAQTFPDVTVKRGLRFVEGEKISTAGGLSSGIDLALRVVDRYFGREVAQTTATYMEYQSKGWMV
jgi:transcriptional regulator GlxA family with amidase domain